MLITDTEADKLASLHGLTHDKRVERLRAAAVVYGHIARNEWTSERDARAWGERNDMSPDDMTDALTLLRESGRVYDMPDLDILPPPSTAGPVERARRELAELSLDELRDLAAEADIEGRSGMKKDELAHAIARAHWVGAAAT